MEVGATQVVDTQFTAAHNPLDVVAAVDPAGDWAMAAATWLPSGGPVAGEVLAVDSARLTRVALWPATHPAGARTLAQPTAAQVATAIGPPVPTPVTITGSAVRVQVSVVTLGKGPAPDLQLEVRPKARKAVDVQLGRLLPGTHDYTGVAPCAAGCTLRRLVIDRPVDYFGVMTGSLVVHSIASQTAAGIAWTPVDARLTEAGQWRAAGSPASSDTPTVGPFGLRDSYSSTGGASPLWVTWTPRSRFRWWRPPTHSCATPLPARR